MLRSTNSLGIARWWLFNFIIAYPFICWNTSEKSIFLSSNIGYNEVSFVQERKIKCLILSLYQFIKIMTLVPYYHLKLTDFVFKNIQYNSLYCSCYSWLMFKFSQLFLVGDYLSCFLSFLTQTYWSFIVFLPSGSFCTLLSTWNKPLFQRTPIPSRGKYILRLESGHWGYSLFWRW